MLEAFAEPFFTQGGPPLSVKLLLDFVSDSLPLIEQVPNSAADVLKQLGPEDELAVMGVACGVSLLHDFTKDKQAVANWHRQRT